MSRDYKPASRPAPRGGGGHPMLVGLVIGVLIGLGIAVGIAYFFRAAPSPFLERPKPQAAPPEVQAKAAPKPEPKQPETPKPRFDFYTILPGSEEPASEQELKQSAQQPGQTAKDVYLLQVGAFQKEADADNLKAKLALIGLEAGIQTASVPDKGVVHRVRVGPFVNADELERARTALTQNGIGYSLVKVRAATPASDKR